MVKDCSGLKLTKFPRGSYTSRGFNCKIPETKKRFDLPPLFASLATFLIVPAASLPTIFLRSYDKFAGIFLETWEYNSISKTLQYNSTRVLNVLRRRVKAIKSNLHYTLDIMPKYVTRGGAPSQRLSTWAVQLRRNVAGVASRWRHSVRFEGPGAEPRPNAPIAMR